MRSAYPAYLESRCQFVVSLEVDEYFNFEQGTECNHNDVALLIQVCTPSVYEHSATR